MKITKQLQKNILKWTEALRSGKYQQGRKFLQSADGYCCLGVACNVFIPRSKLEVGRTGFMTGRVPANQTYAPRWLKNISCDFAYRTDGRLWTLNDADGLTFDEIADVLEAVYIHKVLED